MSQKPLQETETAMCTFTSEDLDSAEMDLEILNISGWSCSRPADNGERCIWHADTVEKSKEALASEIGEGDLYGALVVDTNLSELSFPDATELIGADLTDADLSGADLPGANLSHADLTDADLREADLTDADLFVADLTDADLREADLPGADLNVADLTDADLSHADLTDADLGAADLTDAGLREADLTDARLKDADLTDADLDNADLPGANLWKADLPGANLSYADLTGADLYNANLTDASLSSADLPGANLSYADLTGARLTGASLDHVKLYQTGFEGISIDEGTTAAPLSLWELIADDAAESWLGWFDRKGFYWLRFLGRSASDQNDLQKAEQQYRRLERLYREADLSRDSALEIQEKHARRKRALAAGRWGEWLRKAFARWVLGYGLRIRPIIGVMLLIIGVWTLLYPVPGIADRSLAASPTETGIVAYETVPPSLSLETFETLRRSLYFSTITFSTLGYADVAPVRWGRELATVESFVGALLMAYLVSVLSRRAIR